MLDELTIEWQFKRRLNFNDRKFENKIKKKKNKPRKKKPKLTIEYLDWQRITNHAVKQSVTVRFKPAEPESPQASRAK